MTSDAGAIMGDLVALNRKITKIAKNIVDQQYKKPGFLSKDPKQQISMYSIPKNSSKNVPIPIDPILYQGLWQSG